jgi:hypothetical protein
LNSICDLRQTLEAEDQHFAARELNHSGLRKLLAVVKLKTSRGNNELEANHRGGKISKEYEFWPEKTNNKKGGKNRTLRAKLKNEENGPKNRNSRPNLLSYTIPM